METHSLSEATVKDVLSYLGCHSTAVTVRNLNRLIYAYIRKVPWESVSRIVKRRTTAATSDCPRWPEEFWRDAIQHGFGGTCFESSLAFYCLLTSIGYEGYLTVNDMGDAHGCHAAVVILLNGHKYLVDITIPVHRAVRFEPGRNTKRRTEFHDYSIRPVGGNVYVVVRSHHSRGYSFTLIDTPVDLAAYCAIVENDYAETGLFLQSVVMNKVIDGRAWRFFSDHSPYKLESFNRHGKDETLLPPESLPRILAEKFRMPEDKIMTALHAVQNPVQGYLFPQVEGQLALEVSV